jgi:ATP-dependent DNA helicase RecG
MQNFCQLLDVKTGADARAAIAAVRNGSTAADLESDVLDFKTQGRSVPDTLKDLAHASVCFANARGGTLIVGVVDDGSGPDAVVGCTLDPVRLQRRIYELTDPALIVQTEALDVDGRQLVVVHVPSSPDVHAVAGRSTERVGTSCQSMSPSRIATLVAERRGDDWSAHDSGLPIDEAGPTALEAARVFLVRSADPQRRGYARETDQDLLRRLGLVTVDGTLTNAGALLFTPSTGRERIAYVHRRTPAGKLAVNEHLSGPLLSDIHRVFDLVGARLDRTPVNLPGGQQLHVADLPEGAVREAVINAVMHRDHRRPGAIQIEHTATRLAVTSPGPFVGGVTVHNILTTSSRSRNPSLSTAVRTLGLAETAGTGVDRMYAEMARLGHQPPRFEADLEQVQVALSGGSPNSYLTRFVATLPPDEGEDADTMLVLLSLLTHRTVTARTMSPLLQKPEGEALAVLDRLSAEPVALLERTRESARRSAPVYRLREDAVAALGPALTYRRRTTDEYDRKIIGLLLEAGQINARMVKLMLDLDASPASRVLGDLVERGILVKTSEAQRGPGVTYGPGPAFPAGPRAAGGPGPSAART